MKKAISFSVLLFFTLLLLTAPALAVVEQSESFYVAVYADALSLQTERLIIDYNGALEWQC